LECISYKKSRFSKKENRNEVDLIVFYAFSIRNKISVHSRLVLFPLHFTKFPLNTVSIRVIFGSIHFKINVKNDKKFNKQCTKYTVSQIYLLF